MLNTPDDKSAPGECYKPVDEHSRAVSGGHKDLSALNEGPESSHVSSTSTKGYSRVSRIPPRRIALCGGGIKGIAHVGVIKALKEEGFMESVKEIVCVSAGSLFALLWVIGYSIEQIEELALKFDFTTLQNISPESVFAFAESYGLDSGEGIDRFISSILRQKGFSPDVTFEEVHKKYPIELRCFATELQTSRLRQFSFRMTPKVSVKFAIRASMALPILYAPIMEPETGAMLVDGGVLNNLPLVFLNANEMKETWCVFFKGPRNEVTGPVTSLTEFFKLVFDSTLLLKSLPYLEKFKDRIILVPTNIMKMVEFQQTADERKSVIGDAYEVTKQFLFTQGNKPARRFSAS